jgi:hypothetical protein
MYNCKKPVLLIGAFFMHIWAFSQNATSQSSAGKDGLMRSEGKIYVVMAVSVIILVALIYYLMRLDRKISRLEKGESF